MVPDIFTSLGILGTFVGLVWGLKNLNLQTMRQCHNIGLWLLW